MSVDSIAVAGQRAAEQMMTSTCSIVRITGRTMNPTTGDYTPTTVPVYSGKCRVRFERAFVHERDMESELVTAQQGVVFLPMVGSEQVTVDDIVTVTGSPLDAALPGKDYRVSGAFAQTYATARRLPVEEVT